MRDSQSLSDQPPRTGSMNSTDHTEPDNSVNSVNTNLVNTNSTLEGTLDVAPNSSWEGASASHAVRVIQDSSHDLVATPPDESLVVLQGQALFLGQQIDLHALLMSEPLASSPSVIRAGESGYAVLFLYGVVVLFGLQPVESASFITQISPLVTNPFDSPETEEIQLIFDPSKASRVEDGKIWLSKFSLQDLQIVADVLSKSVVLAHYEKGTAKIFDQLEPFADGLQRNSKNERRGKELLKQLGQTLSIQHNIVGRVEIIDKPELLWDAPLLERIYLRLEDEYEIRERHLALERKLDLISRTAETVLELLQHNTSLRVEWYIVALIVIEILLSIYELFIKA